MIRNYLIQTVVSQKKKHEANFETGIKLPSPSIVYPCMRREIGRSAPITELQRFSIQRTKHVTYSVEQIDAAGGVHRRII